MRTTILKPVESLMLNDAVRLADDVRRFRVLNIEAPPKADGFYRIDVRAEDGLNITLNLEGEDRVVVWVEAPKKVRAQVPSGEVLTMRGAQAVGSALGGGGLAPAYRGGVLR